MNSTILMIAFVLGIVVWLMVLTGLTEKAKKEAKDALMEAVRVHDLLREYTKNTSEMISKTDEIRVAAKEVYNNDRKLTTGLAEIGKKVEIMRVSLSEMKAAFNIFMSEHGKITEESNDRESDEENGDDLEGGDPETTGQGSP